MAEKQKEDKITQCEICGHYSTDPKPHDADDDFHRLAKLRIKKQEEEKKKE